MANKLSQFLTTTFGQRLLPITLTQVVGLVCGIIGVKLSSRLISPEDYGRYGIFLTFAPLGMGVIYVGLIKFTTRYWAQPGDQQARWQDITRRFVRRSPWLLIAAVIAAVISSPASWWSLVIFIFLSAGLLSLGALSQTALQAGRKHWPDFSVSAVGSISRTSFPLICYWLAGGAGMALHAGFTLHALCFAGTGLWILRRTISKTPGSTPEVMPAAYTGSLFLILSLVGWSLIGLNRWLIAAFFGAATAGHFTLAGNLAVIIPSMLGTIMTQYHQPEFFSAPCATESDRRQLGEKIDRVATLFWATALGGCVLLKWILPWLIGPLIDVKYAEAAGFILPAGCYTVALTTGQFYHQMLLACHRESACARVDLAFALVMIAGGVMTAACGREIFINWLLLSPLLPWLINRPLSRRAVFNRDGVTA